MQIPTVSTTAATLAYQPRTPTSWTWTETALGMGVMTTLTETETHREVTATTSTADATPALSKSAIAGSTATVEVHPCTLTLQSSMGSTLYGQTVFATTYVTAGAGTGNETVYGSILANSHVTMGPWSLVAFNPVPI
jgi:hypothetical protein